MRQLGELKRNAGQQFEEKGVKVVAVFREEKQGLDGLKRIKNKTKTDFTLALDTPAKATMAYSNGRKEFDNYVIDKNGVVQGIVDGTVKSRARAEQLLKMVTALEGQLASSGEGSGTSGSGTTGSGTKTMDKKMDGKMDSKPTAEMDKKPGK